MRNPVRKIAFVGAPDLGVTESLREHGYRVDGVPGDSIVGLARALHELRPALVHARTNHLKAGVVAKLLDIPLLVQLGREDLGATAAHASRMAARTLCGGATVRERIIALGAPASATCILRSLLDGHAVLRVADAFPPLLDPALRWLAAASPCDGPDRGHQDLLLAFLSLARARPQLRLLIAGEGPEARKLRAQAEAAGMQGRVVVHAVPLHQLPSVFARAAVVVGPSRSGNAPDPVPEALAAGAAVVATAVGAHPGWVREGRTGWLVPPRAPASLAARLALVLDEPELAKRVGEQARQAAQEMSAPQSRAQELARCYAAVARVPARQHGGLWFPSRGLQRA